LRLRNVASRAPSWSPVRHRLLLVAGRSCAGAIVLAPPPVLGYGGGEGVCDGGDPMAGQCLVAGVWKELVDVWTRNEINESAHGGGERESVWKIADDIFPACGQDTWTRPVGRERGALTCAGLRAWQRRLHWGRQRRTAGDAADRGADGALPGGPAGGRGTPPGPPAEAVAEVSDRAEG